MAGGTNGFAVAALVLGIIGAAVGLIPLLFWLALICGILGVVFGGIGIRRARLMGGRGLAIAGLVLGIIAIILAIIGIVVIEETVQETRRDPRGHPLSAPQTVLCSMYASAASCCRGSGSSSTSMTSRIIPARRVGHSGHRVS